ncbi:conserved hypothetical protein [Pediculus humanus corporis]|uniref:Tudor domain-containing protein n=1 Tax=Pediculus humanus subsp. corporis TaxID=121224 RepID=E0VHS2_PEDHC|nr:uncharacterized protein Phum_PHUM210720 [Pediculus humanus corporis]EEB12845.1 conserved hypothetical protein [Pediculus humanus corporis]
MQNFYYLNSYLAKAYNDNDSVICSMDDDIIFASQIQNNNYSNSTIKLDSDVEDFISSNTNSESITIIESENNNLIKKKDEKSIYEIKEFSKENCEFQIDDDLFICNPFSSSHQKMPKVYRMCSDKYLYTNHVGLSDDSVKLEETNSSDSIRAEDTKNNIKTKFTQCDSSKAISNDKETSYFNRTNKNISIEISDTPLLFTQDDDHLKNVPSIEDVTPDILFSTQAHQKNAEIKNHLEDSTILLNDLKYKLESMQSTQQQMKSQSDLETKIINFNISVSCLIISKATKIIEKFILNSFQDHNTNNKNDSTFFLGENLFSEKDKINRVEWANENLLLLKLDELLSFSLRKKKTVKEKNFLPKKSLGIKRSRKCQSVMILDEKHSEIIVDNNLSFKKLKEDNNDSILSTQILSSSSTGENDLKFSINTNSRQRVLAKVTNMRYYPGILLEELKENVWVVKFNDDNIDEVKKENMIPWDQLGKNDSVLERRENLNLTTDQKTETENSEFITEIDLVSAELKDVNISNAVMIVENSNCLKNSNRKRYKRKKK